MSTHLTRKQLVELRDHWDIECLHYEVSKDTDWPEYHEAVAKMAHYHKLLSSFPEPPKQPDFVITKV